MVHRPSSSSWNLGALLRLTPRAPRPPAQGPGHGVSSGPSQRGAGLPKAAQRKPPVFFQPAPEGLERHVHTFSWPEGPGGPRSAGSRTSLCLRVAAWHARGDRGLVTAAWETSRAPVSRGGKKEERQLGEPPCTTRALQGQMHTTTLLCG